MVFLQSVSYINFFRNEAIIMQLPVELEIGKTYDIAFSRGRYEIDYANHVTCIKITKKKYRLERKDGTEFLIDNDGVLEAKEIQVK